MNRYHKLFVYEMANNHQGSVEHGKKIIDALKQVSQGFDFQFAIKLQYRNLKQFIHPDFKSRQDIKYVKRFLDTELNKEELLELKSYIDAAGFISICTPFDEDSVNWIAEHGFKFLKIASCSLTDWPLLESIAKTDLPLIASTAGASLAEIQNALVFFQHRHKDIALMHCVGEYPTPLDKLQLGQISFLKQQFPQIPIGYSTHEAPEQTDAIKMAIAMGAEIFEKHVGLGVLNAYSASPDQVKSWLESAEQAYAMQGSLTERVVVTDTELETLNALRRGVFANQDLHGEASLASNQYFLAIPSQAGQLLANDLSKYKKYKLKTPVAKNTPLMLDNLEIQDIRPQVFDILRQVSALLRTHKMVIPDGAQCELSHHYGIDNFAQCGATIISIINREYCKKLIILLPGQQHPLHHHQRKEETFNILSGELALTLNGVASVIHPGEMITVERGVTHAFNSSTGTIFEELSTTHFTDDSYYAEPAIMANQQRKTQLIFRSDWVAKEW